MIRSIQPKHILIVDDDSDLLEWIRSEILLLKVDTITTASSVDEAISLLETGKTFNMIVSDYSMGEKNGGDLLKYLKGKNLPIFFILFTGSFDPILPVLTDHFIGIIPKDNMDELLFQIEKWLY